MDHQNINAAFSCALHMHQPTIPAGKDGSLISNLQYMFEHPQEGDNHNAESFAWCYGRMGDMIPNLLSEGCNPRIMLDYSGNLLWGLRQMGREDILAKLKLLANDYKTEVEWLGTMWSHAVATSTPIPDLKLQIQLWQQEFAQLFGESALKLVRGFSLPEMHLPNHPDSLYALIKALKECGYEWVMVQEHSVERLDGASLSHGQKYLPNRLIVRNSANQTLEITALIKTQGSDTKLVGQMQPYFEAKSLVNNGRQTLGTVSIPSLVTQIADGENGGVMMNEFPRDFVRIWQEIKNNQSGQNPAVVGLNGSEYLNLVKDSGVNSEDYPCCQAVQQYKIWQSLGHKSDSTSQMEEAIANLKSSDSSFHMDGASWTNDLSWVRGYENVLQPMELLSAKFHAKFDPILAKDPNASQRADYQEALRYNLLLQTSCFRYWGQGTWTDYAKEIYRRGENCLN
jgi:Glycosyl hydrolase family 57